MPGKVIILCAPSGSGKTTLAKHLMSNEDFNLKFSISATTRKKRHNEKDNIDYKFISIKSFKDKIKNNEFIEYENVYDKIYYGTLKSEVNKLIRNYNVIFDVDVVGAINLKSFFLKNSISIFINPPSIEELEKRLIQRGVNSNKDLTERLTKAKNEIEMKNSFDVSITNDDLERAKKEIFDLVNLFLNT